MAGEVGLFHSPGLPPDRLLRRRMLRRLWARLRWRSLDRALAEGSDPGGSPALACRAAQLTSARRRRRLGRALADVLRAVRGPVPVLSSRVMPDRREVERVRPEIEQLEALLLSQTPVYAEGVARLELIVTDGASAMYAPAYPGQLSDELEDLALALEGREERW